MKECLSVCMCVCMSIDIFSPTRCVRTSVMLLSVCLSVFSGGGGGGSVFCSVLLWCE